MSVTIIEIECYFCGDPISVPINLTDGEISYTWCLACREGVEIEVKDNKLFIRRLVNE